MATLFSMTEDNRSVEFVENSADSFTVTVDGVVSNFTHDELYFFNVDDSFSGGRLLGQFINRYITAPEMVAAFDNGSEDNSLNANITAPGAGNPNTVGLDGQPNPRLDAEKAEQASTEVTEPVTEPVAVEAAPVEAAPVEAAPVEAAPVEAAPVEAAPVEAAPVEAAPVEAAPVETTSSATESSVS